jgi:A/G-specific adenine glycosylase
MPSTLPAPDAPHGDVSAALLDWFSCHRRDLPWRRTYEPYHVWVSEIMLQQTQMERGVAYFTRWVERFPDVAALAEAHEDEVMKHWEGLGYYSRARNLHKAARLIHDRLDGRLPDTVEALQALPGSGPTRPGPWPASPSAATSASSTPTSNGSSAACTISVIPSSPAWPGTRSKKRCAALLPPGRARDFNQALMELATSSVLPATRPAACAPWPRGAGPEPWASRKRGP